MSALRRLLGRPNESLHAAVEAMDDAATAPGAHDDPFVETVVDPTAHAPGHHHLPPPAPMTSPQLSHRGWRRWTQRADRRGYDRRL